MKKFKIFITLITAGAYCLSFILCEPLKGIEILADTNNISSRLSRMMENTLLPSEWGKITDSRLYSNDTLVVYIQDLHCNPEAQRNISNIIGYLDNHCNVSAVFTEGAPKGRVDTKLLSSLPREEIKRDVFDGLIRNGLMAGVEYYCLTQKKETLSGLEDWGVYTANKARLDSIFACQVQSKEQVEKVHDWVRELEVKYLSKRIRGYERHIRKSKEDHPDAYYQGLERLSAESGVTFHNYPHLDKYFRLRHVSETINYDNLNREHNAYLQELKKCVPYKVFAKLMDLSSGKENTSGYYSMLSELSRLYTPSLREYPDLDKYLEYIRLTNEINPISLIYEEKVFIRRAVEKHTIRLIDQEILFLSEMDEYLDNLYSLKINSRQYAYFKLNNLKFKALLRKYIDNQELDGVLCYFASHEKELFAFYDTNCSRNTVFFNTVKAQMGQTGAAHLQEQPPDQLDSIDRLARYKNVIIMVAGGFHNEITQLFEKEGISNITIMPSVTTEYDNTVYRELFNGTLEINKFINAMFSPALLDVGMPRETIDVVIGRWARRAVERGICTNEIQNDIMAWMQENNVQGSVCISRTGDPNIYTATIRGKKYTIDINASIPEKTINRNKMLAGISAVLASVIGLISVMPAPARAGTLSAINHQAGHGLSRETIAAIAAIAIAVGCLVVRWIGASRRDRAQKRYRLQSALKHFADDEPLKQLTSVKSIEDFCREIVKAYLEGALNAQENKIVSLTRYGSADALGEMLASEAAKLENPRDASALERALSDKLIYRLLVEARADLFKNIKENYLFFYVNLTELPNNNGGGIFTGNGPLITRNSQDGYGIHIDWRTTVDNIRKAGNNTDPRRYLFALVLQQYIRACTGLSNNALEQSGFSPDNAAVTSKSFNEMLSLAKQLRRNNPHPKGVEIIKNNLKNICELAGIACQDMAKVKINKMTFEGAGNYKDIVRVELAGADGKTRVFGVRFIRAPVWEHLEPAAGGGMTIVSDADKTGCADKLIRESKAEIEMFKKFAKLDSVAIREFGLIQPEANDYAAVFSVGQFVDLPEGTDGTGITKEYYTKYIQTLMRMWLLTQGNYGEGVSIRDPHPGNFIVDPEDGRVKCLDLGETITETLGDLTAMVQNLVFNILPGAAETSPEEQNAWLEGIPDAVREFINERAMSREDCVKLIKELEYALIKPGINQTTKDKLQKAIQLVTEKRRSADASDHEIRLTGQTDNNVTAVTEARVVDSKGVVQPKSDVTDLTEKAPEQTAPATEQAAPRKGFSETLGDVPKEVWIGLSLFVIGLSALGLFISTPVFFIVTTFFGLYAGIKTLSAYGAKGWMTGISAITYGGLSFALLSFAPAYSFVLPLSILGFVAVNILTIKRPGSGAAALRNSFFLWCVRALNRNAANKMMKTHIFEKYGGEENIRKSLEVQGAAADELLGADRGGTNWWLVYQKLEQLNQAYYTEKTYGGEVEKIHLGELWKNIKDDLLNKGKIDVKSSGIAVFYMVSGQFALHLFRGFYLRHLGSAIRYHWFGKGRQVYIPQQEIPRIVVDQVREQGLLRASVMGRARLFGRQIAGDLRPVFEAALVSAHFRFLKERSSLFIITTLITGKLLTLVALNPVFWLPFIAALYIYAAIKWAPDKDEEGGLLSARGWHIVRMVMIPAILIGLYTLSLSFGVPMLELNILDAIPWLAAHMKSVAILRTLYHGFAVQMILSPFITVFIKSFWRSSRDAKARRLDKELFGLTLEKRYAEAVKTGGKVSFKYLPAPDVTQRDIANRNLREARGFTDINGNFVQWSWDGAVILAYLEAQKASGNLSSQAAGIINAVMEHDGKKRLENNRLIRASEVQKQQIKTLLETSAGSPFSFSETNIDTAIDEARLEARKEVFGGSQFWKRLFSGWFSMWFVNTEIAIVLTQLGLFDKALSWFVSLFSKNEIHIHIIKQLGQIIEGASAENPIDSDGLRLYGSGDLLGKFVRPAEQGGYGGVLGLFGGLVRDIGLATYNIPYLGSVCFAATNLPGIININSNGYVKTDPLTGKTTTVKPNGLIDSIITAKRLARQIKISLAEPEANALVSAIKSKPANPSAAIADDMPAAKDKGLPLEQNEPVTENHTKPGGFIKDEFIFSKNGSSPPPPPEEPDMVQAQSNNTAISPANAPAAPQQASAPHLDTPVIQNDYAANPSNSFSDQLFFSGVQNNTIADITGKDNTFHLNNHFNTFAQQTATSLSMQADPSGGRHIITGLSLDQQTQPTSEFSIFKPTARGSFFGSRLMYNADLYTHKDEQYIQQDGSLAGGDTQKIMPKTTLRYSDANTGTDLNLGVFNAFNGNKKFAFSTSQRIAVNDNFVMAPWADLAIRSAGDEAISPFIGNYGLVTRLYDFTTSLAVRSTPGKTGITSDKIQYFRQFREGPGDIAVGVKNELASRLNPNAGSAPELFSIANPNATSAPREYFVNMRDSNLVGIGQSKGDMKFSYFDKGQRLRLDWAQYMPAASEMLKVVDLGADASVTAVKKGQVWAGALLGNVGFRYKQTIGSFSSLGTFTGQGEVFFNPLQDVAVSLAGGIKDGKLPSLSAVIEHDIASNNLGSAALQFRADVNGASSTDINGASVAPTEGKNTFGASVWAVFRFGERSKTAGSSIHTERSMTAMEMNSADTSRLAMASDPDIARKAYLLSQDNLTQQNLDIPQDFKFGSSDPYNQSIEKMLYMQAKKVDDNSGSFNGTEAQAAMKTMKKTANTEEREYAQDAGEAGKEIADETRRKEVISTLRSSLQTREGYLAEYNSLEQLSVTQTQTEALKPKVENYRDQLLGQSEMDAKELKSYVDMAGAGHSDSDISRLIDAKTEIKKVLGDSPELTAGLKPPQRGSAAYESMFKQFVEQKRFENGPSTEIITDNLREEFENNFSDWRIAGYARQLVARYNEAMGRSPGAASRDIWDSIVLKASNELKLGKFMTSYTYRVNGLLGQEVKSFGESLSKNVFEVETVQDNAGRIVELTGVSKEGAKLFKISNDNVLPVIEIFDYQRGNGVVHSKVFQFYCNTEALQSWISGHGGSMNAALIGIGVGEKTYAVERRGSWLRWIDVKGTTYLPGHSKVNYSDSGGLNESDKNFEETFVRRENKDGTYTKFYEKAGMRDREETYAWKLEEETPVRKLYYATEYGAPLEEVFEGRNNMQSKVYAWNEATGRHGAMVISENTYAYDSGRYKRMLKTKNNRLTGLREEWSDVSSNESVLKFTCRVTAPNGAVMSVKTRTQARYSLERTETSEDFGATRDAKTVNILTGKESLVRYDHKGNRIYTETSGPGANAYVRSFVREYADRRPNESGWADLRTGESTFTAYNSNKEDVVKARSTEVDAQAMEQAYVRENISDRTRTFGRINVITGAESSVTYDISDTSRKAPLYKTEISAMDYSSMKKTTTTVAYGGDGRVEWTKVRQTGAAGGGIKNFFAGQSKEVFEVETVRDASGRITELTAVSNKGIKLFKIENNNVMPTIELFDYPQTKDGSCAHSLVYEFRDPVLSGGPVEAMKAGSIGRVIGEKSYKMERRGDSMRWMDVKGVKFLPGHREIRYGQAYKHDPKDRGFEEIFTRKENEDGTYTKYYEKAGLRDREETFFWRLEDDVPVRKVFYATELGVPLEEVFEGRNNMRSKVYLAGKKGGREERLVYEKTYAYDLRRHDRIIKTVDNKATGLREEWNDVSPDEANIKFEAKVTTPGGSVIAVKTTSQQRYGIERIESKADISGVRNTKIVNVVTGKEKLERSDFKGARLYTETSEPGKNAYMRFFEREYDDKRMVENGWANLRTNESEITVSSHKNQPVIVTAFGAVDPQSMEQTYTRRDIIEQTDTRGKTNSLNGAETSTTYSSRDTAQRAPLYQTELSAIDYTAMKRTSSTVKFREDREGRAKKLVEWSEEGYVNPLYGAGNFTKTLGDGRVQSVTTGLSAENKPLADSSGSYYRQVEYKLLRQKEVVALSADLTPREAVRTTSGGTVIEKKQMNLLAEDGSLINRAREANGETIVERLDRFNGSPLEKERYFDGRRISKTVYGYKKDAKGNAYFSALTVNDMLDTETEENHGSNRNGYIQRAETRDKKTKESISQLSSDDGLNFTGFNYNTRELMAQRALFIGGPIKTKTTYTSAANGADNDEIKSKESLVINDDGTATTVTEFPKTRTTKTDQYDFYGSVLAGSVEKGPDGMVIANKTRPDNTGTNYTTVYYNGNVENISLEYSEGVAYKAALVDRNGASIYSMANEGSTNTYNYANGDVTEQVLKYRGGPVVTTKTLSPSGRNVRSQGEVKFNDAKKRWELLLAYPESNSKRYETRELLWRDGPSMREALFSKDNTMVSMTEYLADNTDNKFHQVTHRYGDHNAKDEVRTENYALAFMNGPPAQGANAGTITEYRYKYQGTKEPAGKEAVTYKTDIVYTGAPYTNRTETIYRIEDGKRMPDFDSRQSYKLVLGAWKPVHKEERYEKWLLPVHGLLATAYLYDKNTGLLQESTADYIDPARAPSTFRTKNEKLFNVGELKNPKPKTHEEQIKIAANAKTHNKEGITAALAGFFNEEEETVIAAISAVSGIHNKEGQKTSAVVSAVHNEEEQRAIDAVARVRGEIARLTKKNAVPAVDIPEDDDLIVGMIYETSEGQAGETSQGQYLGVNIYRNDSGGGLRLIATEDVNPATTETRINVLYEQDNGQVAGHGYTRGKSGLLGSVDKGVDYPVYLTLQGPWKNELVKANMAPLFHGKDEVRGNEVEELFPLAHKDRLLFRAYDAVLGKIYQLTRVDIDPRNGSFSYHKGKDKMTAVYRSAREGKQLLPQYYVDRAGALRVIVTVLSIAFVLPYIIMRIYRRIKRVAPVLLETGNAGSETINSQENGNSGLNGDIQDPVEKSEKLLSEWEDLLKKTGKGSFTSQDIDDLLNKAMFIMNRTSFQVKRTGQNLEGLHNNYDKMRKLSRKTIQIIKQMSKIIPKEDKESKVRLNLIISEFGDIAKYSAIYVNLTSALSNLKVMSGLVLQEDNILEQRLPVMNVSVMMIVRFVFGFWLGIGVSSHRANQVRKLVEYGNNIDPNLYDAEPTIRETEEYVNSFLHQKKQQALGIGRFWKSRETASKIMGVIIFAYIVLALAMISSGISLDFAIKFFCGTGIAVGGSWLIILKGLENKTEDFKTENYSEKFLALSTTAALNALEQEMDLSKKPSADIIIVMATRANVNKYEEFFASKTGALVRRDIPFKVVPYDGNDGAAHREAFHYISKQYPGLKKNGRAVILVTRTNEIENMESRFMNGYNTSRALAAEGAAGKIFVDADLDYIGPPVRRRGEITIGGSWASYKQVAEQNLELVLDNDGRARKIYDDFKLEEISDKLLRQMLKKGGVFDGSNTDKRQMPVRSGVTVYSFNDPATEDEFVELLDGEPRDFTMTRDVIKPLVLLKREGFREMFKGLFSRDIIAEKDKRDPMLQRFDDYQKRHEQSGMPFDDIWVYMPHLHETQIKGGPKQSGHGTASPADNNESGASGNLPVSAGASAADLLPEHDAGSSGPNSAKASAEGNDHGHVNGYVMSPYERSEKLLDEWEALLSARKGNFTQEDAVTARNKVKLIMSLTVFRTDKAVKELVNLYRIYDKLRRLSQETIEALEAAYKRQPETDELKSEKRELIISEFGSIAKYGINYKSAVSSMSSLELLSGYVISSRNLLEMSGIMSFMRFWFGFTYGIIVSTFRVKDRVRKLVELGNMLEPALYDNPAQTIRQADQYADSVERQKKNDAIGINRHWKIRRALPRILGLAVSLSTILDIALLHTGIPVSFLISIIAFGFMTMGNSWFFIWKGLGENYKSEIKAVDAHTAGFSAGNYTERFRSIEHRATLRSLENEMISPATDIVLIMATPANVKKYEELFSTYLYKFVRKDMPFKIVPYRGNKGGAYAEAYRYLAKNYPHLKKNGRAGILVTGTNAWKSITSPVSFPGIEKIMSADGEEIMNIAYQLMNVYKTFQPLKKEGRGGKLFVDVELQYLGPPLERLGEVTLGGSWCNYNQVGTQQLDLVVDMPDRRARKIYEVVNLEAINEKLERHMMTSIYNQKNQDIRQMPVLSPMQLHSFDSEEEEDRFVELLNHEPPDFDMIKDVLSPLILLNREGFKEMYKSIISRDSFTDKEKRDALLKLLDAYAKRYCRPGSMPFDFWVYMPNTPETYISRGANKEPVNGKNTPMTTGFDNGQSVMRSGKIKLSADIIVVHKTAPQKNAGEIFGSAQITEGLVSEAASAGNFVLGKEIERRIDEILAGVNPAEILLEDVVDAETAEPENSEPAPVQAAPALKSLEDRRITGPEFEDVLENAQQQTLTLPDLADKIETEQRGITMAETLLRKLANETADRLITSGNGYKIVSKELRTLEVLPQTIKETLSSVHLILGTNDEMKWERYLRQALEANLLFELGRDYDIVDSLDKNGRVTGSEIVVISSSDNSWDEDNDRWNSGLCYAVAAKEEMKLGNKKLILITKSGSLAARVAEPSVRMRAQVIFVRRPAAYRKSEQGETALVKSSLANKEIKTVPVLDIEAVNTCVRRYFKGRAGAQKLSKVLAEILLSDEKQGSIEAFETAVKEIRTLKTVKIGKHKRIAAIFGELSQKFAPFSDIQKRIYTATAALNRVFLPAPPVAPEDKQKTGLIITAEPPRAPAVQQNILRKLRDVVVRETGMLGKAVSPLIVAGRVNGAIEQFDWRETKEEIQGRGVMPVSYIETASFKKKILMLASLGKGGLGITLLRKNSVGRGEKIVYTGSIVVPVEGASVNVSVFLKTLHHGAGKAAGVLYLSADDNQTAPEAQLIADSINAMEDIPRKRQRQSAMKLLGRGTLALLKELKEGKNDFKDSLAGEGFAADTLEPAVIMMNNVETAFAVPCLLNDEYTSDNYLNSLAYPLFADSLEKEEMQFSGKDWGDINPGLFAYSILDPDKKKFDLMKAALLFADSVTAVSNEDGSVPGSENYPEFTGLIDTLSSPAAAEDTRLVHVERFTTLWQNKHAQKLSLCEDMRVDKALYGIMDAPSVVPIVAIRSFGDIPEIAERLSKAGINAMVLEPCFPVKEINGQIQGAICAYGYNLSFVDCIHEAERLKMRTFEINRLKNILPDSHMPAPKDSDGLLENQFYAAIELYQNLLRRNSKLKEYNKFVSETHWWGEVRNYSSYLAYQRITGNPPENQEMLKRWAASTDSQTRMKYAFYCAVFEYMNYAAYLQLKEAVGAVHRNIDGMKVLMNYTVLNTRDSSDAVFHPELFVDGAGNMISPCVDGQLKNDIVLQNWHTLESQKYASLKKNLEYWFREFGFDGVKLSGIHAYNTIRETGFSPDILFAELADTIRGINRSALIIVEPFEGYSMNQDLRRLKGLYQSLTIPVHGEISVYKIRHEAGNNGKLWVRISGVMEQSQRELINAINCVAQSGIASYVSFDLKSSDILDASGPADAGDIISFLKSVQSSSANPGPSIENDSFAAGFRQGNALPLQEAERAAVAKSASQLFNALENYTLREDFIQCLYSALKSAGLDEKTAPGLWNDIKLIQMRACARGKSGSLRQADGELSGYIRGYIGNALYKDYLKRSGGRVPQDPDIFKKLIADEAACAEPALRDARAVLLNFSGNMLSTCKYEKAKEVLRNLASYQNSDGMIPSRILADGTAEYGDPDIPLWFVEDVNLYCRAARDENKEEFIREMLPAINRALECYLKETGDVQMDETDQLVVVRDYSIQAHNRNNVLGACGGKPVEIQALFYNALCVARNLNMLEGNKDKAEYFDALSRKTASSINERYFMHGEVYPYNVIDGNEAAKHDVRPQALFLVSLSETGGLLSEQKKEIIIDTVEKRLLTPYGLRLLAPENENYQTGGAKKIGTEEQTGPENQGSIWPYYLSFYFRARMNVAMGQGYNKYNRIKNELKNRINNLLYIAKTGALPEAFSGDAPYAPINNQGLSVYSISALIECLAFLNNDLPLKGYNVTAKRNVRLETLVKIFTSFK